MALHQLPHGVVRAAVVAAPLCTPKHWIITDLRARLSRGNEAEVVGAKSAALEARPWHSLPYAIDAWAKRVVALRLPCLGLTELNLCLNL